MAASIWNPGSNSVPSLPPVTPVAFVKGTEGAPGITFSGDTETGVWSEADGYLNFTSNGTTRIRIAPDGTVTFGGTFTSNIPVFIASAATIDLGGLGTNSVVVTGNNDITSFGTNYRGPIFVKFTGDLNLINSASLAIPGAANVALSAGSCAIVMPMYTVGLVPSGWNVISYQNATTSSGGGTSGGGGAVGGGNNQVFSQNDTVVTDDWELGQDVLAVCTISIANPCVVSQVHTYKAGQQVRFTTTATLPTGLSATSIYYVIATGLTTSSFQVSATLGGTAIATTGTQSGTQKCGRVKNAVTAGTVTILDSVTVTVPTGSTWTVV